MGMRLVSSDYFSRYATFLEEVKQFNEDQIDQYGVAPHGVGWNGSDAQLIRFDQLLKVLEPVDPDTTFALNDIGCGYGALCDYLLQLGFKPDYRGFDVSETILRELLEQHEQLYIELSFREGITLEGRLMSQWEQLMTDFQTRFLVGMDTYTPGRWLELPELAAAARGWLAQLPTEVAHDIAYGNAARLFPVVNK